MYGPSTGEDDRLYSGTVNARYGQEDTKGCGIKSIDESSCGKIGEADAALYVIGFGCNGMDTKFRLHERSRLERQETRDMRPQARDVDKAFVSSSRDCHETISALTPI